MRAKAQKRRPYHGDPKPSRQDDAVHRAEVQRHGADQHAGRADPASTAIGHHASDPPAAARQEIITAACESVDRRGAAPTPGRAPEDAPRRRTRGD